MGLRRMAEAVHDFSCGLYDALQLGFGGVVLSDETAVGEFPLESCRAAATFR